MWTWLRFYFIACFRLWQHLIFVPERCSNCLDHRNKRRVYVGSLWSLFAKHTVGRCSSVDQPSQWVKHVSQRASNCRHYHSPGGDPRWAARMASLPQEKETATFRPEGGPSCWSFGSCGEGVYSDRASTQPTTSPRERVEGSRVSDHSAAPCCSDTVLWAAAGGEAGDGEQRGRVAAAVASDAEGAVGVPGAGPRLWMGKDRVRKKELLLLPQFISEGKIHRKRFTCLFTYSYGNKKLTHLNQNIR